MPNGHVHSTASVILAVGILESYHLSAHEVTAPVWVMAVGCLAGIILTPDLDLDGGCESMSFIRDTIGPDEAEVWRIFWSPYAALVHHRSWISHGPIISTLIRVAYIFGTVVLYDWVCHIFLHIPLPHFQIEWWMPYALAGLIVSDLAHIILDIGNIFLNRAIPKMVRRFIHKPK